MLNSFISKQLLSNFTPNLKKGGFPIGTVRNGYKKIADTGGKGDWVKEIPQDEKFSLKIGDTVVFVNPQDNSRLQGTITSYHSNDKIILNENTEIKKEWINSINGQLLPNIALKKNLEFKPEQTKSQELKKLYPSKADLAYEVNRLDASLPKAMLEQMSREDLEDKWQKVIDQKNGKKPLPPHLQKLANDPEFQKKFNESSLAKPKPNYTIEDKTPEGYGPEESKTKLDLLKDLFVRHYEKNELLPKDSIPKEILNKYPSFLLPISKSDKIYQGYSKSKPNQTQSWSFDSETAEAFKSKYLDGEVRELTIEQLESGFDFVCLDKLDEYLEKNQKYNPSYVSESELILYPKENSKTLDPTLPLIKVNSFQDLTIKLTNFLSEASKQKASYPTMQFEMGANKDVFKFTQMGWNGSSDFKYKIEANIQDKHYKPSTYNSWEAVKGLFKTLNYI